VTRTVRAAIVAEQSPDRKGKMSTNSSRYFFCLLLLVIADCAPPPGPNIPYVPDVSYEKPGHPSILSEYDVPAPIGVLPTATVLSIPKSCEGYLPADFLRPTPTKPIATLISFKRAINGDIRNAAIYKTSGYSILDSAVLACVRGRRVSPLIVNGKRAQATQIWGYYWNATQSYFADPVPETGYDNSACGTAYFSTLPIRLNQQGKALVAFYVQTDGLIRKPSILQSSGHYAIDGGAIGCVENFRFYPATRHGKPVEFYAVRPVAYRLIFDSDPSSLVPAGTPNAGTKLQR
jgi:TonB family protein